MCQHHTTEADLNNASNEGAEAKADLAQATTGSRRWRLWELPVAAHCPVIGICIPADLLRKAVRKVIDAEQTVSDYDFHIGTVGYSRSRNPISSIAQKLLDRRFAFTIRTFQAAKTREALAELWLAAIKTGDVAGAFWAALTHPQCNEKIQTALVHDMHLLQHQACAMFRAGTKDVQALEQKNSDLTNSLRETHARYVRQTAEKAARTASVELQLAHAQSALHAQEDKTCMLARYLTTVLAVMPEIDACILQQEEIRALEQRNEQYEKKIRELERQLERKTAESASNRVATIEWHAQGRRARAEAVSSNAVVDPDAAVASTATLTEIMPLRLPAQNVLCVGGRAGNVPDYRDVIEKAGALFAYHDGGIKDKRSLLEASLAAADMVICQTGCISHNAYWRVKDFCKRTGKQCVYVDNPSTSSLIKGLKTVASSMPHTDPGP